MLEPGKPLGRPEVFDYLMLLLRDFLKHAPRRVFEADVELQQPIGLCQPDIVPEYEASSQIDPFHNSFELRELGMPANNFFERSSMESIATFVV